jgi:DNA-directed RNA polymerase beta' subunit
MQHPFDEPMALSRPANPDRQFVEVRPLVPVEVVAVIDAIAMDEGKNRTEVVNEMLRDAAIRHHRRASLIVNASRGNAPLSE